jgi:hypothetical protein
MTPSLNPHGSHGSPYAPHPSMAGRPQSSSTTTTPTQPHSSSRPTKSKADQDDDDDNLSLFGDLPEARKRKFILVDDPGRGGRTRIKVTLDAVNPRAIPDSFREATAVFPRSYFKIEMQSPPPSPRGSRFFREDLDDGAEGGGDGPGEGKTVVPCPLPDGTVVELGVPRMRRSQRRRETKLNSLGNRMAWCMSRTFAGRVVFLQRARGSSFSFSQSEIWVRFG